MLNDLRTATRLGIVLLGLSVTIPQSVTAQPSDTARKAIKQVTPVYPPLAMRAGLTGTVKVVATVNADGTVKSVKTLGGNALFVTAAETAVKRWKFEASKSESEEVVAVKFSNNGSQ